MASHHPLNLSNILLYSILPLRVWLSFMFPYAKFLLPYIPISTCLVFSSINDQISWYTNIMDKGHEGPDHLDVAPEGIEITITLDVCEDLRCSIASDQFNLAKYCIRIIYLC